MITEQIAQRTRELIEKGEALIGAKIGLYRILFNLRGRTAGSVKYELGVTTFRYNLQAIALDPVDMLEDTVPHEVAHAIVFALARLGRSYDRRPHGQDWKRYCVALGGKPVRCHTMSLEPTRKHTKHLYILDSGREVTVKSTIHNKLKAGSIRRMFDTGELLLGKHYSHRIFEE